MCQSSSWGPGRVGLSRPAIADSAPGRHCGSSSQLREHLPLAQTRTFLSPEEVLKGLQGEIEEVLSGISLSVSVLKELYRAYDFCCANMKLFFKVRLGLQGANGGEGEGGWVAPPLGHTDVSEAMRPPTPLCLSLPSKDKEPVPWEFPSSLAFSRINSFFHRVQTIEVRVTFGSPPPAPPQLPTSQESCVFRPSRRLPVGS